MCCSLKFLVGVECGVGAHSSAAVKKKLTPAFEITEHNKKLLEAEGLAAHLARISTKSSPLKGVHWNLQHGQWVGSYRFHGQAHASMLGRYNSQRAAAGVINRAMVNDAAWNVG